MVTKSLLTVVQEAVADAADFRVSEGDHDSAAYYAGLGDALEGNPSQESMWPGGADHIERDNYRIGYATGKQLWARLDSAVPTREGEPHG